MAVPVAGPTVFFVSAWAVGRGPEELQDILIPSLLPTLNEVTPLHQPPQQAGLWLSDHLVQLSGFFRRQLLGGTNVHQRFQVGGIQTALGGQALLESLAAHEVDDDAWGVVGASGLAAILAPLQAQHQVLEDLAQHLRVNSHLHVQGSVLAHGEVVVLQKAIEHLVEDIVAHGQLIGQGSVGGHLEETTVEEGDVAQAGEVRALLGQGDEQREEEIVVEAGAIRVGPIVSLEVLVEIVELAVEPTFLLDKVEEQEAVEELLGLDLSLGLAARIAPGDVGAQLAEDLHIVAVELPADLLDVESLVVEALEFEGAGVGGRHG